VSLREAHLSANDVRVPTPASGEALIIDRYSREQPKAVVLNPADYAYLRETAVLVADVMSLTEPFSAAVLEARGLEDRPRDDQLIEDSHRIAELLGL
jgi:hypothetical protein